MDKVKRVHVDSDIIEGTTDELRRYGKRGLEGLVLWLGEISGSNATVIEGLVPPQTPISNENGVGYLVSSDTLFELNKLLHKNNWRLIAQIHSHPARAYHSSTDDRYAIATKEGSLSIVVPNFASGPADLKRWATYRLRRGAWQELSTAEVDELFWGVSATSKDPKGSRFSFFG